MILALNIALYQSEILYIIIKVLSFVELINFASFKDT